MHALHALELGLHLLFEIPGSLFSILGILCSSHIPISFPWAFPPAFSSAVSLPPRLHLESSWSMQCEQHMPWDVSAHSLPPHLWLIFAISVFP